jgi:hypothetical protein
MDVKEAVGQAKSHITNLLDDEGVRNVGLEEVSRDLKNGEWRITVGFSRKWDEVRAIFPSIQADGPQWHRTYKVVAIDDATKEVISVTSRDENK